MLIMQSRIYNQIWTLNHIYVRWPEFSDLVASGYCSVPSLKSNFLMKMPHRVADSRRKSKKLGESGHTMYITSRIAVKNWVLQSGVRGQYICKRGGCMKDIFEVCKYSKVLYIRKFVIIWKLRNIYKFVNIRVSL